MAGCDIRTVYAGIAGSHIQGFNSHGVIGVKGGEVTQKRRGPGHRSGPGHRHPAWTGKCMHTLPQEFIVDDQRGISDPLGMAGRAPGGQGPHRHRRGDKRPRTSSGPASAPDLNVANVVLESLASSPRPCSRPRSGRSAWPWWTSAAAPRISLVIFSKDSIKHTSVLALGGHNLTNDIAYGLRTPMQARPSPSRLDYGCALADLVTEDGEFIEVPSVGGRESPDHEQTACWPKSASRACEEILALVDQELIKSGFKNMIAAGVVLTGGTCHHRRHAGAGRTDLRPAGAHRLSGRRPGRPQGRGG